MDKSNNPGYTMENESEVINISDTEGEDTLDATETIEALLQPGTQLEAMEISPIHSDPVGIEDTLDSPDIEDEALTPATDNSGRATPASQSDQSVSFSSSEKSTPRRKRNSLDMGGRHIEFDNLSSSSGSVMNAKFPLRVGIHWRKGEKMEAMDYMHKWFPVKIRDINEEDLTVLIHFDGWNQRFDEWVSMSSDRIRPLIRHSDRKGRNKAFKISHKVGEQVYAKWTDCKMYPAKITAVLPNGSYEVIFYDGFKKQVQPINLRAMPTEFKQKTFEINPVPHEILKKAKIKRDPDHVSGYSPEDPAAVVRSRSSEKLKGEGRRTSSAEKAAQSRLKHDRTDKTGGQYKYDGTDTGLYPDMSIKSEPVSTQTDYSENKNVEGMLTSIKQEEIPQYTTSMSYQPTVTLNQISVQAPHGVPLYGAPSLAPKAFVVESDHNRYKCDYEGCNKGFRKEHLLEYHIKYYHIDGGRPPPPPQPSRKRRKTISTCSTEGDHTPHGKRAGKKQRNISMESALPCHVKQEVKEEPAIEGGQLIQYSQEQPQVTGEISTQTSPVKTFDQLLVDDAAMGLKHDTKPDPQHSLHQRTSSQDSNMTEEGSVTDADEFLKPDELVNCICDFYEENGLMIQCEVCMCWQHASCFGITERTLPKTYVCFVCENPPGVRESSRYIHEQDWFKTGEIATFSYLNTAVPSEERCNNIKSTQTLIAEIHQLNTVLHSLKMQLKILRTKDEAKLKFWRMDWDITESFQDVLDDKPDTDVTKEQDETNKGSNPADQNTTFGDIVSPPSEKNGKETSEANTANSVSTNDEKENESNKMETSQEVKSNGEASTSTVQGEKDGGEKAPIQSDSEANNGAGHVTPGAGHVTPSGDGGEVREVTTTESTGSDMNAGPSGDKAQHSPGQNDSIDDGCEEGGHSDSTESAVEDPIEMCERNLLSHILRVQAEISDRLDKIDEQVTALESLEAEHSHKGPPVQQNILSDMPHLKRSMKHMQTDLYKVKKMAVFH